MELLPSRCRNWRRPVEPGLRLHRRRTGQEPHGVGDDELRRARHRQYGSPGAGRHPRAEEAVAGALAGRQDPFGLRHDRAALRLVRRQERQHPRHPGGQRVRHQRREALHLRCRRPSLQDHDHHGPDQPGRPTSPAPITDPGAHRCARVQGHRPAACVRRSRRAARSHARGVRQRPGAGVEHAAGRGPRL